MFEFGFAKEDITPVRGVPLCGYFNPRPNKGMKDPLSVKAAAFRSNGETAVIVSYDLCFIVRSTIEKIKEAAKAAGIDCIDRVLFSCTHTHTGPYTTMCFSDETDEEYMKDVIAKSVNAIKKALASLAPAELYGTQTECTTLAYNRRYWMKDGSVLTNPGKLNPNIDRPAGAMDPSMPILAVKQDGFYRLIMTNIVNHTDTIGGDYVSADWPGRMESEIQFRLGYDIPVMTIIGCQGNINHFDVGTDADQTSYAEATRIGKGYAAVILQSLYKLNKIDFSGIKVAAEELEVPFRQVSDEDYEAAKKVYEANKDAVMEDGRDFTSEDIAKKHPYVLKYFAERLMSCRDHRHTEKRVEMMMTIKFGDKIGIVSLPCEPFVEIGLGIKEASPFPFTFVAGLSMGEVGYVGRTVNYQHGNSAYETAPDANQADVTVGESLLALGRKMIAE
ncbi:MAG: neutral/alkaline non-lysosomal ceramidase N-terminal domain-containing protein [Victivallales bacterium]|nr:neutral/alkaline non-lysosomal ceramidase N-terminal domain-containing protein [Victivallales bacterium]